MTSTKIHFTAGAVAMAVLLVALPAGAQDASAQQLVDRIERLQRELSTLQRHVYRGEPPPPAAATPAPGPTESGAASSGDPRVAARNSVRISQLETEIRRLTGSIEELDHRMRQVEARVDRLVADVDQRLTELEGGQPNAGSAGGEPSGNVQLPIEPQDRARSSTPIVEPPIRRTPDGRRLGSPPRTLGTLPRDQAVSVPRGPESAPSNTPAGAPAQQASASPTLPPGSDQEQYDYALSLMLQKQDFATAEKALRAFVEQHPDSSLAGNAYYWLGETYYVRKNYQDAAFTFAEGFQKYPKGNKAPDGLLKLGMALAQLDKTREACTAYSRLLSNFPDANARLKARVQREQSRANCQ